MPAVWGERRRVALLIPSLLAVHNLEEALAFPHYLPLVRDRVPATVQPLLAALTYQEMLVALAIATLVPFAVAGWALARPSSRAALWSLVLVQAVVLLNVAAHAFAAAGIVRGYSPGLVTAIAINLPFSLYVLRRVIRERWFSRRALVALVPAAIVVHGPLLVAAIAFAGTLMG